MDYAAFEKLLKINKTTVYRVSKATGIAASTFTDWKQGRSSPKADKLLRIAAYFDLSLDEMLSSTDTEAAMSPRLAGKHTSGRALSAHDGHRLPIIGEIRAGSPIVTNETILGYEYADINDGHADEYFYLKVRGDSMKNCGMVDGSLVLFHKQQYAQDGEIVACLVGGDSATVKRFFKHGRRICLMPENEEYTPILLTPEDFESGDARILGVAQEIKIKL